MPTAAAAGLPYFDDVLAAIERDPDGDLARAFGHHFHWGCFPDGTDPADTGAVGTEGYLAAAHALTARLVAIAGVGDGMRLLDVGCGFGGTLAHVDERVERCGLTGINIDERQLRRARDLVPGGRGNAVSFLTGDACALPVGEASVDALLAVECVFHFPSRKQFFREAARVLRPGATLALSDFVVRDEMMGELGPWLKANEHRASDFYGAARNPVSSQTYRRLARVNDFELTTDDDITANTLPTYAAMRNLYEAAGLTEGVRATDYLEAMALDGVVQYRVLGFTKR